LPAPDGSWLGANGRLDRLRSAAGFASVRESGLCPLFLLPFPGNRLHRQKERGNIFLEISNKTVIKAVEDTADRLITTIQGFAEPLLADMGIELVEIQFRREGHGWVLRLFIDKEGGITIDDCAAVSREISAYLEVEDLIVHAYHLEVSSPGLERPIRKKEDFVRYIDRLARIKLREPMGEQKVLVGTLLGLEGDTVILALEKETVRIDLENISKARLTL